MSTGTLSVQELCVSYGGHGRVLERFSLEVADGEFVALLGSSGCGKTTLLRAVSGFVPVEAGRVLAGDRDITHAPPDRREMAMVFQSYALWPHMTAAQNIAYGLKLRRLKRADIARRVDEILGMLKLEGLGPRPVTRLSGGQRQRVALGRALAVSPRFLLLDEPLSNLDAQVRLEVRHEIKALQEKLGITTVHVTHDREEAMVMADRLVIMDRGRAAQIGTPEEVYNRPASPFVAAFMGASNVMTLEVRPGEGTLRVAGGDFVLGGELPLEDGRPGEGVHLAEPVAGPATVHFRSEAARLVPEGRPEPGSLTLVGRIVQSSYPGGHFRYAVQVGDRHVMVDDEQRLAVGDRVGIALPAARLHIYPSPGPEGGRTSPPPAGGGG